MKILRKPPAAARVGVTPRTLERWATDPAYAHLGFPKLVKIGPNCSGFVEEELDAWLRQRMALRDAPEKDVSGAAA